jgi:acyl carrier protein
MRAAMSDPVLRNDIKRLIVDTLKLEGVKADEIGDSDPLFSKTSGLGLDSLNALEILTAVEYQYKVRFPNDGTAKQHFENVDTLARFVETARPS